ncbi:hypothetical protein BD289DRAFT_420679 [Coniella lustricola]|uniref:Sec20 C-terminal domain-containing protein n=1 Tax=Coniella lustricola TaxID=2025994 RepID=A0A2T3AMF4_9PEZI|nr:hypothetical protein BD289DRAFT_420679 [Coniella lustricola]
MSFDALQERLATLQDTTTQVRGLIDRLSKLDFQSGSVPLPQGFGNNDNDNVGNDDDENVATELSGEINQILREEEEDLELLAEEVTDLRGGKEGSEAERQKSRLREGVSRLEDDVKSARIAFHKAQLTARRSLEAARRLERQILLRSYASRAATNATTSPQSRSGATSPVPSFANPSSRRRQGTHHSKTGGDPVISASSDLTRSLHRARQIVQDELARSMTLHETLQESTTQLKQLGGTYGRMEDMLVSSRDLLGTLMKSTKSDTWYLQTTFYMLAVVLGWLVFRRFFYGPLWWLVWLPLRLVFKTGSGAVGMVGGAPGGAGSGARMEVVDGAGRRVEVDMGQEGVVPTAKVGKEGERTNGWGDPDSMAEQIGRIIDGEAGRPGKALDEEADVHQPVVSEGEDGRVRDEL